jgi:hypothetical protein
VCPTPAQPPAVEHLKKIANKLTGGLAGNVAAVFG